MQTYNVRLESPVSTSFKCVLAANSLDIDVQKKSIHELSISCDINSPFNVGLIVGSSGSGKTTLAKEMFGQNCFNSIIDNNLPIIEQFPQEMPYEECANMLAGVGLTSVPCWIRPVYTLSNGQRARAEAALLMNSKNDLTAIDEWTSVVDRTVAKVMSHCVQKFARKFNRKIVLNSCHYDVIEWLDPDWIIDCNTQKFIDRRLLSRDERTRKERLEFSIKEVSRDTWKYFSKYHYLSEKLPGGSIFTFGLFHGENQIGFQCFANYTPTKKNKIPIYHSNRVVIHPDYAGMGLGMRLVDECSRVFKKQMQNRIRIMAKFSSVPMYRARMKNKLWKLKDVKTQIGKMNVDGNIQRKVGYRENIKTYSFEYID